MNNHDEETVPAYLLTAIEDLSDDISSVAEILNMIATCPSAVCYLPSVVSDEPKH